MFVILNFTEKEVSFELPDEWESYRTKTKLLIGNYKEEALLESRKMYPFEAVVYINESR